MSILKTKYTTWLVALLLALLSLAIYFNTIMLGFFSDDFYVMHRLTIDKVFWAPGFFRPLSDISLLINFKMFGYHAYGYRLTNIFLHVFNGCLLYKTAIQFAYFNGKKNQHFALIVAVLFISYPFHSEAIIWIVGRASLLGNTLAILGLYFYSCRFNYTKKIILIGTCYFLGISAYESAMVLPGLIFFLVCSQNKSLRQSIMYILPLAALLGLHFVVRKLVSGVIFGNYGVDMFQTEPVNYFGRFVKSIGRLFVPGMHNSSYFIAGLLVAFLLILVSFVFLYNKRRQYFTAYCLLWILLIVCQVVPGVFGVDTHTSDGDRMLYLPSVILCSIFAFTIVIITDNFSKNMVATICLLAVFVMLQLKQNNAWQLADAGIKQIIATVTTTDTSKQTYIANLPESIDGSFMFRNGFKEALVINKFDSKNIKIINCLRTIDAINYPSEIVPQRMGNNVFIYPQVVVQTNKIQVDTNFTKIYYTKYNLTGNSQLFFWNKKSLVRLF